MNGPKRQESARGMSATDVQLGVASTFVCEPIGRWLGVWLDALGGTTVRPRLRFAGYQQLHQELRQPAAFRGALPAHTTLLPPACQHSSHLLVTTPCTTHAPGTTCLPHTRRARVPGAAALR